MSNGQNVELDQEIPKTKRLLVELENIFRQLEIITERSELIREMDKAILRSTFSPQEVLNLIVEKCLSKTDSQHGQVVQYRHNRLVVVASTETSHIGEELPLHKSLCGKAVIEEATQHYPDISQIPPENYVRYHEETKSELAVLIQSEHSARVLGVLNLERDQLGLFDPTSVEFAELLAGQAAIAIRHAQTWSGVKMLYGLSTSLLSGNITLEKSYQAILEAILEEFDFEHGQILQLVDNEFVILASSRKEDIGLRLGKHTSVCGQYLLVEQGRELLVIDDIKQSPYGEFYLGLLEEEGRPMRSEMIVPLIENENFIGALNIESPRIGIFTDFERNLIGVVGGLMASALTATFKRASQVSQGRIQAANLALTQLGHVAQSFLHRFGNNIGDARGRLLELKEHLTISQMPPMRGGRVSTADFITDVTEKLTEASRIIDDFSDRFNPSHPRFQLHEMDMERVAEIALDRTRSRYANQPIKFHFENLLSTAETGDKEEADKRSVCYLSEQVYEVIENLLNNAVEAIMERGEDFKEGQVSAVLEIPDPFHILLRIQDNGAGIAELDQQRIFEFGYTSRKGRRSRGIGLWFCDLYVKQRGGKINFGSTLGVGTTFEILFPTILAGIKYN